MNFQQLRIIRETLRQNYNLTEVAQALFTSQSGVSKHIKDLEDELGVEIFIRKGKRLLGLTDPGKELAKIVERMLLDAQNIKRLADQFSQSDHGQLTIATTHTQARYALPPVVSAFKKAFPKVHLALHQGSPQETAQMLLDGRADLGIATESLRHFPELVTFPFYSWHHAVIAPQNHPLAQRASITLEDVAEYPIVTYHAGFTGRNAIDEAFASQGIATDVVMSALDADVIKTYVELGLGVGIIASMAYHPDKDSGLRLLESSHLFAQNTTRIAIRQGHYLRDYAYTFLHLCAEQLSKDAVQSRLHPQQGGDLL
jgi:LysR family cys regulon transcriptional activator